MKLPIADCRLPIKESFAGRGFARSGHDGGEFVGFLQQGRQFARRHDAGLDKQFEPERSFISFFLDCPDFGDEFRLTRGTATGAIVGRDRGAAANNLLGDDSSRIVTLWNRAGQFDDAEGKGLGVLLQLDGGHAPNVQTQSAIGDRQSAITK